MCNRCFSCNNSHHNRRPPTASSLRVNTDVDVDQTSTANGGLGGSGGISFNYADIEVNNILVIIGNNNNGGGGYPPVSLGMNGTDFQITSDEYGNTLLNGEKMNEQALADGTRVFLFKNKKNDSYSS